MLPIVDSIGVETSSTVQSDLCRVSVLGGNTQLDVGLPANVPIAVLVPDLVELIGSRNPDLSESDGPAAGRREHWTLARIGQSPIPPNRSLLDAGVYDGDLLVLRSVGVSEVPALFDDVIDAVSGLGSSGRSEWSAAAARVVGAALSVVAVIAASAGLLWSRTVDTGPVAPVVAFAFATLFAVGATVAVRAYSDHEAGTVLAGCAVPLAFVGSALIPPGDVGIPHALLGFATTALLSLTLLRVTGTGATLFACTTTVSSIFAGACTVVALAGTPTDGTGAGVAAVSVLILSLAPRMTILLAKLPLPPVPTRGEPIDPTDHEQRPTIEGIGAIGAMSLPSAAALGHRATTANSYLTGIVTGATITATIGTWFAADALDVLARPNVAFAVVVALVLCLRGRSHADLTRAAVLITGGALIAVSVLITLAVSNQGALVAYSITTLAIAGSAAFFGYVSPTLDHSPVMRRLGELVEYTLIAAIGPLMFWVMNLYSLVRNL